MSQQLFAGNGRIGDNISSRMNGFRNQMTPFFIAGLFTAAGVMLAMGYNDVYGHLGTSYEAEKNVCKIISNQGTVYTTTNAYGSDRPGGCHYVGGPESVISDGANNEAQDLAVAVTQCAAHDVDCGAVLKPGTTHDNTIGADNSYLCTDDPAAGATDYFHYDFISICGYQCTRDKCMDHARETNTFHNTIFWITAAAMMGYYAVVVVNTLFYSDPPSTTAGKDLTFGNSALITLLQALVIFLNIFFVATTEQLYEHDDTTDNYDTHPATMVFWGWLIFIGYCSIASNQFEGGVMSTKVSGRVDASGKAKSAKAVRSIHW
jgi:hypothetical protein